MGEAWKKWPYFLRFDQLYALKGLHFNSLRAPFVFLLILCLPFLDFFT